MSTDTLLPKNSEVKGQPTWVESNLPDLRTLARELRKHALEEVSAAITHEDAIEVTVQHLGFIDPVIWSLTVETPMGDGACVFPHSLPTKLLTLVRRLGVQNRCLYQKSIESVGPPGARSA